MFLEFSDNKDEFIFNRFCMDFAMGKVHLTEVDRFVEKLRLRWRDWKNNTHKIKN